MLAKRPDLVNLTIFVILGIKASLFKGGSLAVSNITPLGEHQGAKFTLKILSMGD
jgi:hypothetical protein